jgi:hypothetical protein
VYRPVALKFQNVSRQFVGCENLSIVFFFDTADLHELAELHRQIQSLSQETKDYSDPSIVLRLPFPSLNIIPARFSVSDGRAISYMGREFFLQLWDTFVTTKNDSRHRQAIYVYGSQGFGKSHILAALACLLVRKGERVVYIPDCPAMLLDPFLYLRTALLFAFTGSIHGEGIRECEDVEGLADFCSLYRSIGQLCFVVDQWNALDPDPTGQDKVDDRRKFQLHGLLERMSERHISITCASATQNTFKYMALRDTGERKIRLMGGMTPVRSRYMLRR